MLFLTSRKASFTNSVGFSYYSMPKSEFHTWADNVTLTLLEKSDVLKLVGMMNETMHGLNA